MIIFMSQAPILGVIVPVLLLVILLEALGLKEGGSGRGLWASSLLAWA